MSTEYYKAAAQLYSDVFISDEPTTHLHAPDPSIFIRYAEIYVRSLIPKNLSFIALDSVKGDIIGFIFCLDLASDITDEGEEMVRFLSHFHETVLLIDELEHRFLEIEKISAGEALHIFQIGVDKKYRRSKIAHSLIHTALDHGRNLGFSKVIADCTSSASLQVFSSCGFELAGFIDYDACCMNGEYFFAGLDGGISLVVKKLDDVL
ncbi:GNAT family N-acetyltransferase [Methanospirillum hungatei]|uniref:GNAT family N-acetyltransferase n=1 Tax=Methanospirillum hungatei TaxID=2203 RepID=UPI002D07D389|nr:GNAT family N-acetyltransferase [Methanospirillum hungatei]HOW05168.1 GNAT family N-acetyltransferase [Methanospirillum hungatei]